MPWQWQLASQVLVPMISGAIERQRQRDENRKNNALLAKTMNDILSQGQPQTPMPQGASGGYGSNNWENAFHSSQNNPMAQFDAGTADLMPPSMQGVQAAIPQQKAVGSSDFLRALAANMGTERFGMVDTKAIQELATPYITSLENARKEAQRKGIADDYMNAQDALGKRNALMNGAIQQIVSENLANMGQSQYMADRPQPMMQDLGGSIQGIMYNPTTGTFTNTQRWDKSPTPQQAADNQYRNDVFDYTKQKDARDFNEDQRRYDLSRQDANRPKYGAPFAVNRKLYQIDQNGDTRPFMIGDEHIDAPENTAPAVWTDIDKAYIEQNNKEIEILQAQRKTIQDRLADPSLSENQVKGFRAELKNIDNKIAGKVADSKAYIQSKYAPKGNSSAPDNPIHNIISNANTGRITGHYGEPRKVNGKFHHYHQGIDLPGEEGEPIKVTPEMGSDLKVSAVNDDPNASTFGCYVKLEGTRNGKKVEILLGHMKAGSLNVKEGNILKHGDILGGVGNTGRSSGNHVHVEVWVDGNRVDPEKFFASKTSQGQAELQDGTTITQATYERLKRLADTGMLPEAANSNELNSYLDAHGIKIEGNTAPVQQGQPSKDKIASVANNPALNWTPSYQRVNMPDAYTVANAPIPQPPATPTQNQTVAGFSTSAAYAAEPPNNTVSSDVSAPVVSNDVQLAPPISSDIPVNSGDATLPIAAPPTTSDNIADVLREAEQGMPQYDLSSAELTASLPGSGAAPRPARRIDPDSGLTQYRAEGDNTPVTWRDKNGRAKRTSDGQLFTQGIYEDWKRKADAGHFKDVGINNAEDLNKWLESVGMRPDRPSEQREVNNLNGNTRANANLPSEDENITPFNITPSNSPEKFQAPEFTDEINGTTPSATQDLLDGLNGITDSRYRRWTKALKRFYPSGSNLRTLPYTSEDRRNAMIEGIGRYLRTGDRYALHGGHDLLGRPEDNNPNLVELANNTPTRLPAYTPSRIEAAPQAVPQRPAVQRQASQRPAPKPRAGYTNYEQQRTHVDGAAKRHGIDSALIRAIIETESSWRPNARSKVGAMGLMQLMPKTAKWLGVRNAYDPAQNIEGGSKYIAQLIRQFGGNVSKALMAYNCGPGNVKKGRIPAESRRYAQKVLGIYRRLKGQR